MRKHFPGYYPLTDNERAAMWKDATFALDTNVLLNMYRYTSNTRDHLFKILEKLESQLWLPYQVASEFSTNKQGVITKQESAYDELFSQIVTDHLGAVLRYLDNFPKHAVIDVSKFHSIISNARDDTIKLIEEAKKSHPEPAYLATITTRIADLFDEKVGNPYATDELQKKLTEAKKRYDQKIPPGYKDKKDEPKQYGDIILWFQMIDRVKETSNPLIFVTDDSKEDWWQRINGKTLGPRPELMQEMVLEGGNRFYMYQTERFIGYAADRFGLATGTQLIGEVRELVSQQELAQQMATRLEEVRREIYERQRLEQTAHDSTNSAMLLQIDKMFRPRISHLGIGEFITEPDFRDELTRIERGDYPRWSVEIAPSDVLHDIKCLVLIKHVSGYREAQLLQLEIIGGVDMHPAWKRIE